MFARFSRVPAINAAVDECEPPLPANTVHRIDSAPQSRASHNGASAKGTPVDDRPHPAQKPPARIAVKAKGKILFVTPADVVAVEAQRNYVLLRRRSGSCILRESISVLAQALQPYGFVRIHRSVIVNAALVEEIQPCSTGEYLVRLTGGKEYVASRTYKANLRMLAESWIGADPFLP
ncbi:MAG TPA: LytTR family DNA-binding domain-containing protein [Terriglobales bacterium]|nr:LytTR family DNA-binding domain-containing protein [Terriglobales bacterium]